MIYENSLSFVEKMDQSDPLRDPIVGNSIIQKIRMEMKSFIYVVIPSDSNPKLRKHL